MRGLEQYITTPNPPKPFLPPYTLYLGVLKRMGWNEMWCISSNVCWELIKGLKEKEKKKKLYCYTIHLLFFFLSIKIEVNMVHHHFIRGMSVSATFFWNA